MSIPSLNGRRGAPPGNLNAIKHGRRSKPIKMTKRAIKKLRSGIQENFVPEKEFDAAFSWTRRHNAGLTVAALKRAAQVRWHVQAVEALLNGEPQPPPPVVMFSPYELRLMKLYMEQRALIRKLGGAGLFEEQAPLPSIDVALKETVHVLEEWQLLSSALEDPVLLESADINPAEQLPRLRALLANIEDQQPSALVPPLHAMERAIAQQGERSGWRGPLQS
jgi:hypothetical protein